MPSTGTGMAPAASAPATIAIPQPIAPKPIVDPQVRHATQWFFWVVAAAVLDSLFVILGSHIHRFTGLGATALVDKLSGARLVPHVMVNGWVGTVLLYLGFFAVEGRKGAFLAGMALYAIDVALVVAAQDYFSIPFHSFVLYMLYRGYAAFKQASGSAAASVS